jgi:hypothetical protein
LPADKAVIPREKMYPTWPILHIIGVRKWAAAISFAGFTGEDEMNWVRVFLVYWRRWNQLT